MPEVRLRLSGEANAVPLGDVPLSEEAIDRVIPLLDKWGVALDGEYYDASTMSGMFVIKDGRAFFEVEFGQDD